MQEANKKFLLKILPVLMPFAVIYGLSLAARAMSTSVNNNVSATANTGGNAINGSGTIKTGDAEAKSSVETEMGSNDQVEIKIDAQAEANGEMVEEKYESDEPHQNADIYKEASGENAKASVEISIDTDGANTNSSEKNDERAQKGIFSSVKEKFGSFIDKVISLFT